MRRIAEYPRLNPKSRRRILSPIGNDVLLAAAWLWQIEMKLALTVLNGQWWSLVRVGSTTSDNQSETRTESPSDNFIWPTHSRSKKRLAYQQVNFLGPEDLGIGQAKISWYFPVFRAYCYVGLVVRDSGSYQSCDIGNDLWSLRFFFYYHQFQKL